MTDRELSRWRDIREKGILWYVLTRTLPWVLVFIVIDFWLFRNSVWTPFPNWWKYLAYTIMFAIGSLFDWIETEKLYKKILKSFKE